MINIIKMKCVTCHTEPKKFYQVDYICDNAILVSNYYEQIMMMTTVITPSLNDVFCDQCLTEPIKYYQFEKEGKYTFEQNGYTCWDVNKYQQYKNYIGDCVCCNEEIILNSLYTRKNNNAYISWPNNIISQVFPDCNTKVFTVKNLDKYGLLCVDCFKICNTEAYRGPIDCQLCHKDYDRWIFHHSREPVIVGSGCDCHYNKEDDCIYDGYIDPLPYQWVNKPRCFNNDKPFCQLCLQNLQKSGDIREDFEYESKEQ